MYDVIIIGAGPAGLTAAIYTSRAGLKTLIIESASVISQAAYADRIENYPGFSEGINGTALLERFKGQAGDFGAEFEIRAVQRITRGEEKKKDIWQIKAEKKRYDSLSVIIASGAKARPLGVPGEEKLIGRGVSYCATCDGAFFKDKLIAVVGGGDTAVEEALFLTKFGKKVMLVHRRDRLRATRILQDRAFSNKKVEVIWNSVVEEILGSEKVEALRIKDLKHNKVKELSCDGVFISVGFIPNTDFVKDIVELDKEAYIIVDNEMKTSQKGLFACGDCRNTPLRQIVTACGDGAIAAYSCQQYVEGLKGTAYP